jgi:hypothetical protein
VLVWSFPGSVQMAKEYGDVCFLDATFKVSNAGYDIMEIVLVNDAKQQIVVGYVNSVDIYLRF